MSVVDVLNNGYCSFEPEFAQLVREGKTEKKPVLTPQLVRLVRHEPDITSYDKRKAKEHLGYESRPLDVMIQDCYDWLQVEGRI